MEYVPTKKTPILIVDDDTGLLQSIRATLVSAGKPEPALVSQGNQVMDLVRKHGFHLILLDLIMPDSNGMEVLKQVKQEYPDIECVMVTAVDEVSSAVQAMKYGAYDYLVKPLDAEKLVITLDNALERYNLKHGLSLYGANQRFSDLQSPEFFRDMVAEDESMALIFHQAETIAPTDYNLSITGESGTGKEMLAQIIHRLSHRSKGPFTAVNMAASSQTLFEDEFFGHTKGAFTGAMSDKKGFFEAAQGGTLFLDEITELDPTLQGKLLRVIQERELYRLGSSVAKNIDVRIIVSSNRNIKEEVEKGHFRGDVFYRLNTFHIRIPPLRERKKDILPLANHFLKVHTKRNTKKIDSLAPDLADCLFNYSFPGNVRELENIIAASVLLEKQRILTLSSAYNLISSSEARLDTSKRILTMHELEKKHIYDVLNMTKGNKTQAAKLLSIGLRTLQRKLKSFESSINMQK